MQPASAAGSDLTVEPANLVSPEEESEVQRIARQQAEGDMALLKALQERKAAGTEPTQAPFEVRRMPMNRAERRQQVALYARVLTETERQVPVVNPTIVPKSKRRRRRA